MTDDKPPAAVRALADGLASVLAACRLAGWPDAEADDLCRRIAGRAAPGMALTPAPRGDRGAGGESRRSGGGDGVAGR